MRGGRHPPALDRRWGSGVRGDMAHARRTALAPLFALLVTGCGAAAPEARVPATATLTQAAPSPTPAAPLPGGGGLLTRNLPEVAAMGEVFATYRWRDPLRTLVSVSAEVGVTRDLLDEALRTFGVKALEGGLGEGVDAAAFAATLDWASPLDGAMAVDPLSGRGDAYAAVSIGIHSLPRALAAFKRKPIRRADGGYGLAASEYSTTPPCALFEAAGQAPVRLVCGADTASLDALGPYLATSLPKRELGGGELHAEVRLRKLLDRVGPALAMKAKVLPLLAANEKIGVPAFDNALMEAASALGDEAGFLLADLDSFDVDGDLTPGDGLQLTLKATFAGRKSWVVSRLLDAPSGQPKIPYVFLGAPASAATGSYSTGLDLAPYQGVLRLARGLVEGKLTHVGFATPADRKAIAALLRSTGTDYAGSMSSSGSFGSPGAIVTLQDGINAFVGYLLTGVESDSRATAAWLKDLVAAYNRPAVQAWMKGEMKNDARYLPTVKLVRAPAALGAGALDIEVRIDGIEDPIALLTDVKQTDGAPEADGPKKAKLTSVSLHLLLVPDGKRFFVGLAADRDKLVDLMVKTKANKLGPDSVAASPTLEPVRREAHRSAAYSTLRGTLGMFEALRPLLVFAPAEILDPATRLFEALERMPNGGKTPIVATTDVSSTGAPALVLKVKVARGSLDDAGFLGRAIRDEVKKLPPRPQP